MALVKVAAVQLEATEDVARNLKVCLQMIDDASRTGAKLIVLPEFCNHLSWYTDRAHARSAATTAGDEFLTAISARAALHRVFLKINVTHAYPDGRTGGTNFLFGPDGSVLGQCDKQVLMGSENDFLDPATQPGPVISTPLGRLGMYACMEGVIPEVARGLALRGAQVLLNSLNSFATDEASLHIPVRAAENEVWVVAANKVGPLLPAELLPSISAGLNVAPHWLHGAGESQIVAPDGTVVAKGPGTGAAVVTAWIDPGFAGRTSRVHAPRRPSLYQPLAAEPRGRQHAAGAPSLRVAVVRGAEHCGTAIAQGAELLVVTDSAPENVVLPRDGTVAVVLREPGEAAVLSAAGEIGTQREGEAPQVFSLPWGRLAVIVGTDSLVPEHFRLAAVSDVDVVAVLRTPEFAWELSLGLPERAAENRMNIVAATPQGHAGAVFGLSEDFTLWTKWKGPFMGRISHPLITEVKPAQAITHATVAPAQAANRLVSRNTNLVDGRPWRLLDAITQAER